MFCNDDIPTPSQWVSMFERLEASTPIPRVSAFDRLVFPSAQQPKGTIKQKRWMPKQKKPLKITIRQGHETQEDEKKYCSSQLPLL